MMNSIKVADGKLVGTFADKVAADFERQKKAKDKRARKCAKRLHWVQQGGAD